MTAEEFTHYTAVYAAIIGSDPQRDHDNADKHARQAVVMLRKLVDQQGKVT